MEIFKKLTEAQREALINNAYQGRAEFVFKYSDSKIMKAKVEHLNRRYYITCRRPREVLTYKSKEEVVVVLAIDGERYFFKSSIHIDGESLLFKRDADFYKLVRRKNKRLKIPEIYPASLMIKRQNLNLTFLRAVVLDFSDTGCKVALNTETPNFKNDDEVTGTLRFGDKKGVEIHGEVKHSQNFAAGIFKQTFGLKFFNLSPYQESYLKTLFLDLQREIFVESYKK